MQGLGDKPVRTSLTHTNLPPDCVTALNKLGRFDEIANPKSLPDRPAIVDQLPVLGQAAKGNTGDFGPQLGHRLSGRGDSRGFVARIVGRRRARPYGALLLTAAHGAASFESSSHFVWDKWHTNADGVIDSLIALLPTGK